MDRFDLTGSNPLIDQYSFSIDLSEDRYRQAILANEHDYLDHNWVDFEIVLNLNG